MYASTLLLLATVSYASAQSTTTLFLPGFDQQAVLASVVGSDAEATAYALACPPGESADDCGIPPSFTLTQGPATAHFTYSADGSYEQVDCSLGGTTTASCIATATPVQSGTTVTTTSLSGPFLASQFQMVTLTDNLAAATGATPTSGGGQSASAPGGQSISGVTLQTGSGLSTTMAAQTSTPTSASTAATTTATTAASGTSSATAATKTSTAGMSKITGNAGWAAGGVVLALAVAGL